MNSMFWTKLDILLFIICYDIFSRFSSYSDEISISQLKDIMFKKKKASKNHCNLGDSSFALSFSSAKQRLNCFPSLQIPGCAEHWASLCGLWWPKWQKDSVCGGEWLGWLLTEPHASGWPSSFPALSAASHSYHNRWHIGLHQIKWGTGLFWKEKVTWIQGLLHVWGKKKKKRIFFSRLFSWFSSQRLVWWLSFLGIFVNWPKQATKMLQSRETCLFLQNHFRSWINRNCSGMHFCMCLAFWLILLHVPCVCHWEQASLPVRF